MKTVLMLSVLALWSSGCANCPRCAKSGASPSANLLLHQFSRETGTAGWRIQNDAVMGGLSRGGFAINEEGNAVFSGEISLANNGGFSSVQSSFEPIDVSAYRALFLGLKGDGKRYQVRVESEPRARHGYAFDFDTTGEWQVVKVPFAEMYAIRHGDRLDLPHYPGRQLARIQILAGDGREESFRLEIDRIWLEP